MTAGADGNTVLPVRPGVLHGSGGSLVAPDLFGRCPCAPAEADFAYRVVVATPTRDPSAVTPRDLRHRGCHGLASRPERTSPCPRSRLSATLMHWAPGRCRGFRASGFGVTLQRRAGDGLGPHGAPVLGAAACQATWRVPDDRTVARAGARELPGGWTETRQVTQRRHHVTRLRLPECCICFPAPVWNGPVNQPSHIVPCADTGVLRDTLTLCLIPGVGPRTRRSLLDRFATPAAVLAASADQLRQVPGVGRELTSRILRARQEIDVDREIGLCAQNQVEIVTEAEPRYPRLLREIPDPPGVLFCAASASRAISWRWPWSARGVPRTTACGKRNGWLMVWLRRA